MHPLPPGNQQDPRSLRLTDVLTPAMGTDSEELGAEAHLEARPFRRRRSQVHGPGVILPSVYKPQKTALAPPIRAGHREE